MCILLKLHYAKFGVSNLFFSKVIEEKPLGARLDPPSLVQEGLIKYGRILLDLKLSCDYVLPSLLPSLLVIGILISLPVRARECEKTLHNNIHQDT